MWKSAWWGDEAVHAACHNQKLSMPTMNTLLRWEGGLGERRMANGAGLCYISNRSFGFNDTQIVVRSCQMTWPVGRRLFLLPPLRISKATLAEGLKIEGSMNKQDFWLGYPWSESRCQYAHHCRLHILKTGIFNRIIEMITAPQVIFESTPCITPIGLENGLGLSKPIFHPVLWTALHEGSKRISDEPRLCS